MSASSSAPFRAPFQPFVGVTMRLLTQAGTGDVCDALSGDWGRFLAAAGLAWMPLPNRAQESLALARALNLTGFIFSGGGDAGREPARDATEALLLEHARNRGLPVLGVCRGFQAVQLLLGGTLVPVQGHVAVRHALLPACAGNTPWEGPRLMEAAVAPGRTVNSYHHLAVRTLAQGLAPLALSLDSDGPHVEAAYGPNLLGLMWHPERETLPQRADLDLVRRFFCGAGRRSPQNSRPALL